MKKGIIKNLPASERPYEKCEKYGVEFLSDAELIAVIIKSGVRGTSSVELAREILGSAQESDGLCGLHYLKYEDLMGIKGVGKVKAIQLLCLVELAKRMSRQQRSIHQEMSTAQKIADYYMQELRFLEYEQVVVVFLDSKCRLLKDLIVSKGTVNKSIAEPREILIAALKYKAVNIVLLHNHPSGDVAPSRADIQMTKRLQDACKLIGIPLIDHLIIGDNQYWSFCEQGML